MQFKLVFPFLALLATVSFGAAVDKVEDTVDKRSPDDSTSYSYSSYPYAAYAAPVVTAAAPAIAAYPAYPAYSSPYSASYPSAYVYKLSKLKALL